MTVLRVHVAHHGAVSLEVRGGRIRAVSLDEGTVGLPEALASLIGGFVAAPLSDAHIHLLGFARTFTTPDLGPAASPSIPALLEALRALSGSVRPTGWIVLHGFDDALVRERRLPTRDELDRAVGDVPLRLRHRTGHASLLNSAAFSRLPSAPPSATIEVDRDLEPVMVVGAEDWLNGLAGRPPERDLIGGLREAHAALRRQGILRLWDATPRTAAGIVEMRALLVAAEFDLQTEVMASVACLSDRELPALTVKLFPSELGPGLSAAVAQAHARGARVAIHCTELGEVDAALAAFDGLSRPGDRLEHVSLCTPLQAERIAELGIVVVANPGWLIERGVKYAEQLARSEHDWLIPLRTMHDAGCELAFGSDAPVGQPAPWDWIDLTTRRRSEQSIPVSVALAAARGDAAWRHAPSRSTFIVLDRMPESIRPAVLATCTGGDLVPLLSGPASSA